MRHQHTQSQRTRRGTKEASGRQQTLIISKCCAKQSYIMLIIEKLCFREKKQLKVFDFKNCDDVSVNIKFHFADQHLLKRRMLLRLPFGFGAFEIV